MMNEINSGILEVPVAELTDTHIKQLSEQLIKDFEKLVSDEYYSKITLSQKQRSESISAAAVLIKFLNLPQHIYKRQHDRAMANRAYLRLEKITFYLQNEISKILDEEIRKLVKDN